MAYLHIGKGDADKNGESSPGDTELWHFGFGFSYFCICFHMILFDFRVRNDFKELLDLYRDSVLSYSPGFPVRVF